MRILIAASTTVLLLAASASAQTASEAEADPRTASRTFDNERAAGSITFARDSDAGSFNRDRAVTRKSDGATMTNSLARIRTEDGIAAEQNRTGFDGSTSGRTYQRSRTENGFVENGTATRRNGSTFTLDGSRTRAENSLNHNRTISDAGGGVIASRNVDAARIDGRVTRDIQTTGRQRAFRRRN